MQPKVIVLPPSDVETAEDRVLAEGMRVVWACALKASGADVFVPETRDDRDPDSWAAPIRGRHLTQDGLPITRSADALVTTRLVRACGSFRILVHVDRPGCPTFTRAGRTFCGPSAELQALTATVHTIAHVVGVALPPEVGWRQLTYSDRAAGGIAHLLETGRQCLPHHGEPLRIH